MKLISWRLLILFIVTLFLNSFAQDLKFPSWLSGVWHNSAESSMQNMVYIVFQNDSIQFAKGFTNSHSISLNEKYVGYNLTQETTDSLYTLTFSKDTMNVIYEFKIQKVYYENDPVLTYSINVNGKFEHVHSTSCNLVFLKLKSE